MDTLEWAHDHRRAAYALAERFVAFYEGEVGLGRVAASQWHSDVAGAKETFARDRAAITARVSDLLVDAAPLHSAVRAGRPPGAPKVRILGVEPAAVELKGMALADEGLRARVARLDDLGAAQETPEDTAEEREWAVYFWLTDVIDQTVRLWTGVWEGRVVGEEHELWEGLRAIAATHAERIETDLQVRCPDPWLHSVAGAAGRMLRRCAIVDDTQAQRRSLTAHARTHVLCTQVLYAQFEAAPRLAEVATELAGVAITPDAWRTCTRDRPAMNADEALQALHATLPRWARALEPPRLAHCARTLPAGSIVAGGATDDEDERNPGQRFDATAHVRLRPAYCDARALVERVAGKAVEALPDSPSAWRELERDEVAGQDHGAPAVR